MTKERNINEKLENDKANDIDHRGEKTEKASTAEIASPIIENITPKEEMTSVKQQAKTIEELTTKLSQSDEALREKENAINHNEANSIVKNHVIAGLTLGLIPVPLVDIVVLSGTQLSMLRNLSQHYNVEFDKALSKSLIMSLISGSLPVLTMIGLSSVSKFIPGIGTLGGSASLGVLAGAVTYATGQVFVKHFNDGGTLQSFDAGSFSDFFKQELEKGKTFVKDISNQNVQNKKVV